MKQILFILLTCCSVWALQAQQLAKITLDEVMTSDNYLYIQEDADTKSDAIAIAKSALVLEINKKIRNNQGKTVQLKDVEQQLGTIDFIRGNRYIVIAYIKKDKLTTLLNNTSTEVELPEKTNRQKQETPSPQCPVELTVTDISDFSISQRINKNASALLTELNMAYLENRTPQVAKISGLSEEGQSCILYMWENNGAFCCTMPKIISRGVKTPSGGYQVRTLSTDVRLGIPMYLKDEPKDDRYREIVINFDKQGNIEDVYFALEMHHINNIIKEGKVTDFRRRTTILNFVENFRNAYIRKDIEWLARIYSDDALIITGKVISQPKSKSTDIPTALKNLGISEDKIEYQVKTKKEYINSLRSIFNNNVRINLVFDSIEVAQHPKYDDIYGVTLKQGWTNWKTATTEGYHDEGYLFLMIDFKDGENMEVHVRTWQPDKLNGKPLSEDEIFGLGNFDVK